MKMLLTLAILTTSFSSFALIAQGGDTNKMMCSREFRASDIKPLACLVTTTTSLPTVLIDSVELDLNSAEASERLLAEAHNDASSELTDIIAHELNAHSETIKEAVLKLQQNNIAPTIQNIAVEITK